MQARNIPARNAFGEAAIQERQLNVSTDDGEPNKTQHGRATNKNDLDIVDDRHILAIGEGDIMKLAVLTKDVRLFEQVRECFHEDRFTCDIFHDDISLIRGIKRAAYDLILLGADMDCAKENPVFS